MFLVKRYLEKNTAVNLYDEVSVKMASRGASKTAGAFDCAITDKKEDLADVEKRLDKMQAILLNCGRINALQSHFIKALPLGKRINLLSKIAYLPEEIKGNASYLMKSIGELKYAKETNDKTMGALRIQKNRLSRKK